MRSPNVDYICLHIPVIAKALDEYAGAMILVSHVKTFVAQIRIDQRLDLEKLTKQPKGKR